MHRSRGFESGVKLDVKRVNFGNTLFYTDRPICIWTQFALLFIEVEQELVGRKGNLGKTSNSVKVYFLLFQFLLFP